MKGEGRREREEGEPEWRQRGREEERKENESLDLSVRWSRSKRRDESFGKAVFIRRFEHENYK
eukprot:3935721-Rhodomonas_salina.2